MLPLRPIKHVQGKVYVGVFIQISLTNFFKVIVFDVIDHTIDKNGDKHTIYMFYIMRGCCGSDFRLVGLIY
jgi:hypothetical protein